jgi:starch phosphorylase
MARLTPRFSANRTVREYTQTYYIPAAEAYQVRTANQGAMGEQIVNWQHDLKEKWAHLRFGEVRVETAEGKHIFEIQVYLNGLDPDSVRVELYADGVNGNGAVRLEMTRSRKLIGTENGYIYIAEPEANRPVSDFTARVIPFHSAAVVPLEASQIFWQR